MKRLLLPIAALLMSDALLLLGHGLILTLLPIRAETANFSSTEIGLTGSAYFIGFVVGCLLTPRIVQRVGHIRTFAVLCSVFSAVVLLFHAFPNFPAWLLLRFMVGACISGLYMVIESWLNERSTRETRGTILSIYTIINFSMIMIGQQLLNFADPSGPVLFGLAAILLSLAIVPVCLTLSLAPAPIQAVRIDLRRLWTMSHVGMGGAVASGLVTGAFWAMGPVLARGLGLDTAQLTLFLSVVVLGGALFQLPLGRLSDHYDRRLVVFYTALGGAIVSLLVFALPLQGIPLLVAALLWGGGVMTLYALCLAHATDHAEGDEFVMVGSGILLVFAVSSAIGAPLASLFMATLGPRGLFAFAALCLVGLTLGISIRRRTHVKPVVDETEPFRPLTDTSPALFEMDPRTECSEVDSGECSTEKV